MTIEVGFKFKSYLIITNGFETSAITSIKESSTNKKDNHSGFTWLLRVTGRKTGMKIWNSVESLEESFGWK